MTRILIIDDNKHILDLLKTMLEPEGYEVDEAPEGRTGLQLYKKNQADLVITDLVMPEMEGLETITRLRKENPEVKIIAISGSGAGETSTYLDSAKTLGANRTFAKPFRAKALLKAIEELLNE